MPQKPNAPWSIESGAPITAARSSATRSRGSFHAAAAGCARESSASSPCQVGAESLMIPLRGYPADATRRQRGPDGSVFQPGSGIRTSACRHGQSTARPVERGADRVAARRAADRPLLPPAVRRAAARAALAAGHRAHQPSPQRRGHGPGRGAEQPDEAAHLRGRSSPPSPRRWRSCGRPGTSSGAATPRPTASCAPSSRARRPARAAAPRPVRRAAHATRPGCASPAPAPTSRPTSTTSAS